MPSNSLGCLICSRLARFTCSESKIFISERLNLPHGELKALAPLGLIKIVSRDYTILPLEALAPPLLPNPFLRLSPMSISADFGAFPLSVGPLMFQMKLRQSMQGAPPSYKILPSSNASESTFSPVMPQSVAW